MIDMLRPAIAQLAEHLTVDTCSNQMVPGSIPGGRTSWHERRRSPWCCAISMKACGPLLGLEPAIFGLAAEESLPTPYPSGQGSYASIARSPFLPLRGNFGPRPWAKAL